METRLFSRKLIIALLIVFKATIVRGTQRVFSVNICSKEQMAVFILKTHYPSGRTWENIL